MLCTEYFIPSPPVQTAYELILGMSKMVCFPRQVADKIARKCLTRTLSLSLSLHCFLSQHSSVVVSRLNQCTVYQRLDRGGEDFPSLL